MRQKIEISEKRIVEAVRKHGGILQEAARELGISPSTLGLRLREMGYERVIRWEKEPA